MSALTPSEILTNNEEMFACINVYLLEKFLEGSPNLSFEVRYLSREKSNIIVTMTSDGSSVATLCIDMVTGGHLRVGYISAGVKKEEDVAFFSLLGKEEDVASDVESTFRIYLNKRCIIPILNEPIPQIISNESAKIMCSKVLVDFIKGVPELRFNTSILMHEILEKDSQISDPFAIVHSLVIKMYRREKIIATLQFRYLANMHLFMTFRENKTFDEYSAFFSLMNNMDDVAVHVSATFIDQVKMLTCS